MEYVLMTVSIVFAALNSIVLHKFKNRAFETLGDSFAFNGGISAVWTVILLVWFLLSGDTLFSFEAAVFGIAYGIILCLFLYFKLQSMASGPVSLSTLIGSCAFIIAAWFGVIYASEQINVFQIIGMILILVALVMCVNPQKSEEKLSLKWFLYCLGFFFAGGFVGIIYKVFGRSDVSAQVNAMLLTAAVFSAVVFTMMGNIINHHVGAKKPVIHKDAWKFVIASGIFGCVYIRLNIPLSNIIPSAVFFPISNGAMVVLSTLAGDILFKEKLSKIQKMGIILAVIAIVINGCGSYIWRCLL